MTAQRPKERKAARRRLYLALLFATLGTVAVFAVVFSVGGFQTLEPILLLIPVGFGALGFRQTVEVLDPLRLNVSFTHRNLSRSVAPFGYTCSMLVWSEISELVVQMSSIESLWMSSLPDSLAKVFSSSVDTLRKFSSRLADLSTSSLAVSPGSWVVMPTGHLPVLQALYCWQPQAMSAAVPIAIASAPKASAFAKSGLFLVSSL